MSNAEISIIIPVYKIPEKYLRYCVDSVKQQTSDKWKMILVDDGSPDNSGEICDNIAASDDRISVIHQQNQGVSVARNAGIDASDTKWVTFVDPDDWIEKTMVEKVLSFLEKNDAEIVTYSYTREYSDHADLEKMPCGTGKINEKLLGEIRLAPLHRFIVDGKINPYSINAIWNKIYSRDFLNRNSIRFEPEARKGQDRIFNLYALDLTDKVYFLDEVFYHYRNDFEESIVNRFNTNTVKNAEATFRLMRSWITKNNKPEKYNQLLNCRISIRFFEYMRLYYFNESSNLSYSEAKKELINLLNSEPYFDAMKNIDNSILTKAEKVFVFCVKHHFFRICKALLKYKK